MNRALPRALITMPSADFCLLIHQITHNGCLSDQSNNL
jgi:hypothetical protein